MWLKKTMTNRERYVQFSGALEIYNEKEFPKPFSKELKETSSEKYGFRYALDTLRDYLNVKYLDYEMNLLNPQLLLCFQKDRVFFYIKSGPELRKTFRETIELNPLNLSVRKMKNRYYAAVFDKKRERLRFFRTNIIPNIDWLK